MTDLQHFDDLYANSEDPWGYENRWYERRKRDLTIASLPRERYTACFEPGCSIGALTAMLATRCDGVLAVDSAGAAVSAARRRNGGARNVRVEQMQVPAEWPSSSFDLIVVSELGYYLNESALGELLDNGERCTTAGAHLVAVHWRGHASDFALAGGASAVRRKIVEASAWRPIVSLCDEFFLLDVVERR